MNQKSFNESKKLQNSQDLKSINRGFNGNLSNSRDPLLLTLKISIIATFFVTVLGILIAYILAKKEFPGKWAADVIVTLPMVLPRL